VRVGNRHQFGLSAGDHLSSTGDTFRRAGGGVRVKEKKTLVRELEGKAGGEGTRTRVHSLSSEKSPFVERRKNKQSLGKGR